MLFLFLKTIHVLSATVLFGTGLGTAYYMWRADRSGRPETVAAVSELVVSADWWLTTPAVVLQPFTGFWLMTLAGYPISQFWIWASLAMFFVAGACWLPVVRLQIRMARLARQAVESKQPLPAEYHRAMRQWVALGWPAFVAMIAAFFLMVFRPS